MRTEAQKKAQAKYLAGLERMIFRVSPEEIGRIKDFQKKSRLSLKDIFFAGLQASGFGSQKKKMRAEEGPMGKQLHLVDVLESEGNSIKIETTSDMKKEPMFLEGFIGVKKGKIAGFFNLYWKREVLLKEITPQGAKKYFGLKRLPAKRYYAYEAIEVRKIDMLLQEKAIKELKGKDVVIYKGKIEKGYFLGRRI